MAELYTATIALEVVVHVPITIVTPGFVIPAPVIQPAPHPRPGQDIAIFRTVTVLHIASPISQGIVTFNPNAFTAEYVIVLVRASDSAPMGGLGLAIGPGPYGATDLRKEAERDFTPHFFRLTGTDSLALLWWVFMARIAPLTQLVDPGTRVTISNFAAINYALFDKKGDVI